MPFPPLSALSHERRSPWLPLLGRPSKPLVALVVLASLSACSSTVDTPAGSGGSAGSVPGGGAGAASTIAGSNFGGSGGQPTGGTAGGGSGGQAGAGGSGGGGAAAIEPSFNTLKSIIQMSCFGGLCHDLPENPLQLTVNDGLHMRLTTYTTEHCGPLLKPGAPQDSALVKLLKGPCGETDRMPYGKCFEDADEGCVRPEQIAAIEKWIANGAPQQ